MPRKSGSRALEQPRTWHRQGCFSFGLLTVAAACSALAGNAVAADVAGQGRTITLVPSLSVTQTITDNHLLSELGRSDAITRISGGLGLRTRSSAMQALLDYTLSGSVYAQHSRQNALQNALNARLRAELLEDRLTLNASAAISQGAISAFGVQRTNSADANANSTEVRTLQVAPSLRGMAGPSLRYTALLSQSLTDTAGRGGSSSISATFRLEPRRVARLVWSLDASHIASDFSDGRATQTDRLFGRVQFDLAEQDLQLTANAGAERSNLSSLQSVSRGTWGVAAVWAPSPVTRLSADLDERAFGRSYAFSLEHRLPRLSFRLRSARALSTSSNLSQGGQSVQYELVGLEFASITDPVLRDAAIRRRLLELNLDPSRLDSVGFLSSAVTLRDTHEFSVVWGGRRDSLTTSVSQSKSRRADTVSNAIDDLSQAGVVTLSNLSANWSHRLTPSASMALTLSASQGRGKSAVQSNRQKRAELQFNTRLTPESSATVSLRRGLYRTALQPYDESALTASYSIRF